MKNIIVKEIFEYSSLAQTMLVALFIIHFYLFTKKFKWYHSVFFANYLIIWLLDIFSWYNYYTKIEFSNFITPFYGLFNTLLLGILLIRVFINNIKIYLPIIIMLVIIPLFFYLKAGFSNFWIWGNLLNLIFVCLLSLYVIFFWLKNNLPTNTFIIKFAFATLTLFATAFIFEISLKYLQKLPDIPFYSIFTLRNLLVTACNIYIWHICYKFKDKIWYQIKI